MTTVPFDFQACLNKAWITYKENLWISVGVTLLGSLLIGLSCGILSGPIMAGLMFFMIKRIDGNKETGVDALFSQFDSFKTTFLISLVWSLAFMGIASIISIVPVLGQCASILLGIAYSVFITFATVLAAERKMAFGEASFTAYELVKNNLWPLLGFTALASFLSSAGALVCGIGALITMPFMYTMLAVAYRECTTESPASELPAPDVD